jgi:uncharacterized protein (DUF433 family)
MNWKDHLTSDPSVLFGKVVIKNTRIPVELILEKLGHGYNIQSLLAAYPHITNQDILACLLFAADSSRHEKTLGAV